MKINLPKSTKSKIKTEREKVFEKMCKEDSYEDWELLNKKYKAYTEMMKPSWTVTPDTLVVAGANLLGIILILNFEKMDLVRSKAMNFVLKGKV